MRWREYIWQPTIWWEKPAALILMWLVCGFAVHGPQLTGERKWGDSYRERRDKKTSRSVGLPKVQDSPMLNGPLQALENLAHCKKNVQ